MQNNDRSTGTTEKSVALSQNSIETIDFDSGKTLLDSDFTEQFHQGTGTVGSSGAPLIPAQGPQPPATAFAAAAGSLAPYLAGDEIPFVDVLHMDGCCCPGCGGMPAEPTDPSAMRLANDAGDALAGSTLSAAAPLGDMADFLTTDFWANYGTVPREFNLTDSGSNPKSGVLHYNVTGFSNAGGAGTDTNGLSADRAELVRDVLDVFGEVLGISFVETGSSNIDFTDIFFKDNDAGSAYTSAAGFSSGIQYAWINIASNWSGGTSTYNDYTLQTIFHEVGHALGLGHQGLYNGTGAYPSDADFTNDSWQATIMSYFSQSENTFSACKFCISATPMAVDWIALQDIYGDQSHGGVNFGVGNAFLGDTVYGFNTNISSATSEIWAQYANYADKTASTIVDAGGTDTLDLRGYSANQLINLTPTSQSATTPSLSNIGGLTGNLSLAEGTIIENAVGGSGNDTFIGNDADNTFTGRQGNDIFNDSLGSDSYFGGSGVDTVNFLGPFSQYSFSISGTFLAVVDAATDFVENTVEFLSFGQQTFGFQDIVDGLSGNTAPAAANDTYATNAATVLAGLSILENDTDADGDSLNVATVNGASASVGSQITLASGALLTVRADGKFNYDPNGAFDGLSAAQSATDSFSYTATDGSATSTPASVTITVDGLGAPSSNAPIGQSGVATVSQAGPGQWHTVAFAASIDDAVVVLGPATSLDGAPMTTRVRNVTDTGFQFQLDEWDYLDGVHGPESIGWLAISEGSHSLSNGQTIVASNARVGTDFAKIGFGETLTNAVVLTEVSSVNQGAAVTTRIRDVTGKGFETRIEEEEAGGDHADETVSWIAIEAGLNADFEAFATPDEVTHAPASYSFASGFASAPVVLADMQSADGVDTSTTRIATVDKSGVSLFIEEEQSVTAETNHTAETVGVVAFGGGLLFADGGSNAAPVARDDNAVVAEGAALSVDVLANDTDPDADLLILTEVDGATIRIGDTVTIASGARVTLNADQTLDYDQNGVFDGLDAGDLGSDQFTYTVADGTGATADAIVAVAINGVDDVPSTGAIGQSGVATVDQSGADEWHSVSFAATLQNAVVVLGPVTYNGSDPVTTRVRNVTDTGFEFQIDEWDYLDGRHSSEDIGWLAISEGSHRLSTGQTIVAATATVDADFSTFSFGETLSNAVVFAEATTVNQPNALTTRIRDVTNQGFDARLQQQQANGDPVAETLSWIAIESAGANGLEVVRTGKQLDDTGDTFVFNQSYADTPVLLADMQSTDGRDNATVRLSDIDANGFTMFVEEEQSADEEVGHLDEVAGYAALAEGLIYLDSFQA